MSFFELYLITTLLPNLSNISSLFALAGAIVTAVVWLVAGTELDEEDRAGVWKNTKTSIKVVVVFGALAVLIPSQKALLLIYSGQYLTNNENVKKLPDSVAQVLNKLAQDYLEEQPKQEKKK